MVKYLKSAKGEVQTEEYWRKWCDDAYKDLTGHKPVDYWERMKRVLGLKPCRKEK